LSQTTLVNLNAQWAVPGAVHFEERYGGPVAVLEAAGCTAVVALQGAQVLSFIPRDNREVLWLSPVARLATSKAVRGGIPICWPWFGPAADDAKRPAHGFVRAAPWDVIATSKGAATASIRLGFDATTVDPALWPNRARAEVEISAGDNLTVAIGTENLGRAPFALTQALHTYLAVGDIARVAVEGLQGRPYIDQLTPGVRPVQSGPINFSGEVDRIYQATCDTVIVTDRANARRLTVAKSGSRSTVIWNPWEQKSARLGDMGEGGYVRMLCVETANAGDDVVTLAPGARHRLACTIAAVASGGG
jgi:glucose-6-phosphate 1-epimerase